MGNPENSSQKSPTSHLHAINLVVALLAGIISIVGGIYTLKSNVFSGPSYGSLEGIVRDEKIAKPLLLASAEVSGIDGAVVNTVATDSDGRYLVETLKTGNYVVKFTAPRHIPQTKTVKIEKDLKSLINVDLVPEPEIVPQAVISPERPAVAPVNTYPATSFQKPTTVNTSNPVSDDTTSQSYGPTSPGAFPPPPGTSFHRRGHRDYYGTTNTGQPAASQNNDLTQAGIQLVQQLIAEKSDQTSGS